jgi:type I restriction enzyme M protein
LPFSRTKNGADGDDLLGDSNAEVRRISRRSSAFVCQITSSTTIYDPICGSGSLLLKFGDEAVKKITSGCPREVSQLEFSV